MILGLYDVILGRRTVYEITFKKNEVNSSLIHSHGLGSEIEERTRSIVYVSNSHRPEQRIAVCEVPLEQLEHGLNNLHGYQQAAWCFAYPSVVIEQAWLTVDHGHIPAAMLRTALPTMAWPVWQQLVVRSPAPAAAPDGLCCRLYARPYA